MQVLPLKPCGSLTNKKCNSGKVTNVQLMPDIIKRPSLNILWQAIGDLVYNIFLKSQLFFKEYKPTAKQFFAYLNLIVCEFHWDQLMTVFYVIFVALYTSVSKADKICAFKIFELTHI